ncbi:MAG: 50S ribosomal protein L22 [Oscillospiraceae bacterium]|nr:50S ribosomal protein L22 [Oscillospiraceae bacterium]
MEARAEAKFIRISPRKVKIVCDLIRGKDVGVAQGILLQTPKAASEVLLKLLKSAGANAENNHEMDPDSLYVAEVHASGGPILKRGRPRAHGRMFRINKRTSHITLVVKERTTGEEA